MPIRTFISVLGLALLLTACFPVPSIHPLCSEADAIFDPNLVGVWSGDEEVQLTISRSDGKSYILTLNAEEEVLRLHGSLVRFGETSFLDLGPLSEEEDSEGERLFYQHLLAVHTIYRVRIDGDKLTLSFLDDEWLEKKVKSREVSVQHTLLDDDVILLTASTSELQTLVKRYAQDAEAFSDLGRFTRSH